MRSDDSDLNPLDSGSDDLSSLEERSVEEEIAEAQAYLAAAQAAEEIEFLPGYDSEHTSLDRKKAKLLEAYLLKPMSISAQGIYKPLSGVMTTSPTFQYQSRNHISAINQPIYIDARNGDIYFWADNFALAISESLDDKLGTSWKNKWLKLSLNDGSLPAGFGRDLIKSHFSALDKSLDLAPLQEFTFMSPKQLNSIMPPFAPKQLPIMLTAKNIASQQQSYASNEAASNQYLSSLYDQIAQKYPDLVTQADSADDTVVTSDPDGDNYVSDVSEISDVVAMDDISIDEADAYDQSDASDEAESIFTSRAIVKQVLSLIKSHLEEIDTSKDTSIDTSTAETAVTKKTPKSLPATTIQYAKVSDAASDILPALQYLYGYDGRGQLIWKLQRVQLPKENSLGVETGEGLTVDALTHYKALTATSIAYPNLPAQAQVPTASNTVDLKVYGKALNDYYESGEGTEMGKTIFAMLSLYKYMALEKMQGGGDDYVDAEDAAEVEDAFEEVQEEAQEEVQE